MAKVKHTEEAYRAAKAIDGVEYDGFVKDENDVLRAWAEIIDRETGLPDLLAAREASRRSAHVGDLRDVFFVVIKGGNSECWPSGTTGPGVNFGMAFGTATDAERFRVWHAEENGRCPDDYDIVVYGRK